MTLEEMDHPEVPEQELPGKRPTVVVHRLAQEWGTTTMRLDVRDGDVTGAILVNVEAGRITVSLHRHNPYRGSKKLDESVIQTAESFTASRFTDPAAFYETEDEAA